MGLDVSLFPLALVILSTPEDHIKIPKDVLRAAGLRNLYFRPLAIPTCAVEGRVDERKEGREDARKEAREGGRAEGL